MSHGDNELYVAHSLATHFLLRHLHTAMIADYTLVADTLVFPAMAFVVLDRTEDLLAEESVALRLIGAVVDGLGLQHFSATLGLDFLRGGKSNRDFGEVALYLVVFL